VKPVPFHYRAELGTAKDQWTPIPERRESTEDLHRIVRSLKSTVNASGAAHGAGAGARTALEPFKTQPCQTGRTRLSPKKAPEPTTRACSRAVCC
jgi:hypothetical protein